MRTSPVTVSTAAALDDDDDDDDDEDVADAMERDSGDDRWRRIAFQCGRDSAGKVADNVDRPVNHSRSARCTAGA
jgi:hypothetical protein